MRIDAGAIDQIAWMRNNQMVGVSATTLQTDHACRRATIITALIAEGARAAPGPRIDQTISTKRCTGRIRSRRNHRPKRFVTEGERWPHATLLHRQAFATAEIEVT